MSAPVEDGVNVWRDKDDNVVSRTFDNVELHDGNEVRAHVVSRETEGEVSTLAEPNRRVRAGDVLVELRPGVYDVYSHKEWGEISSTSKKESTVEPTIGPSSAEQFDPDAHSAADVRAYLERDDVSDDEKQRVTAAERASKNRSSAFPSGR